MRRGDEVSIEHGDELATCPVETRFQGAGFVSQSVGATNVRNVEALFNPAADQAGDQKLRLVRGIVQNLNLESVARPVKTARRVDQPLNDVELVEDRKLNRHVREVSHGARGAVPWRTPPRERRHVQEIEADAEEKNEREGVDSHDGKPQRI